MGVSSGRCLCPMSVYALVKETTTIKISADGPGDAEVFRRCSWQKEQSQSTPRMQVGGFKSSFGLSGEEVRTFWKSIPIRSPCVLRDLWDTRRIHHYPLLSH